MPATTPEAQSGLNHRRVGAGEPLLLVHPTWRAWLPVIPALSARHDVVSIDLPGFGGSAPLPHGVASSVPTLAAAVEEQLDRLGWETAHVAGNSLGGWVALELARRGRARTVVAIAPMGLGTDRENRRTRRRLRLVHVMGPAARPFVRPLARTIIGRTLLASAGMQLARPWRHEPAEMVSALEQFWLAPGFSETFDWALTNRAEGLEQIRSPVTIAWGTRDLIAPSRQVDRFARRIPQAQVRMLKGLGHDAMVDDSVVVAGAILQATAAGSREQLQLPGRRR